MAKVRQHDGDLYVSGNLRVLGGIQNVKNSETVTRLATSEAAITVVESTLTEAVEDIATITEAETDPNQMTPKQKQGASISWNSLVEYHATIMNDMTKAGVPLSETAYVNYDSAYDSLYAYLFTTPACLSDLTTTTTIVYVTFSSLWLAEASYRAELQSLIQSWGYIHGIEDPEASSTKVPVPPVVTANIMFNTAYLRWPAQAGLSGEITHRIERSDVSNFASHIDVATVYGNTYTDEGLALNGTDDTPTSRTYYYRVIRIVNATVESNASNIVSAVAASLSPKAIAASAINAAKLAAGAVADMTKFASTIRPPRVVTSIPTTPYTGYENGDTVVLNLLGNADHGKLFRLKDKTQATTIEILPALGAWSKAVSGGDIVADSITAGSIAAGAIGATEIAADAVTASKIVAGARNSPNDPVAYWSMDSVPEIPDDPAGVTYLQDAWATVDGWNGGGGGATSFGSGNLIFTHTGANQYATKSLSFASGTLKLKVRLVSGTLGGNSNNLWVQANFGSIAAVSRTIATDGSWSIVDVYFPSSVTSLQFFGGISGLSFSSNYVLEIDWIYIGTGAYLPNSLIDNSGNANHGTIYGATPVEGISGKALAFDGVNDYVQLPTMEMPDIASYNLWVTCSLNTTAPERYIYFYGTGISAFTFRRALNTNDLRITYGDGTAQVGISALNLFLGYDGVPINIGLIVNWTSASISVYRNGSLFTTLSMVAPVKAVPFTAQFGAQGWLGTIDEPRIYNRALTEAEIKFLYENKVTTTGMIITDQLVAGAVTADKIFAGAITTDKLAAEAVTAVKIKAGEISTLQLATGIVTSLSNADSVYTGTTNYLSTADPNGTVTVTAAPTVTASADGSRNFEFAYNVTSLGTAGADFLTLFLNINTGTVTAPLKNAGTTKITIPLAGTGAGTYKLTGVAADLAVGASISISRNTSAGIKHQTAVAYNVVAVGTVSITAGGTFSGTASGNVSGTVNSVAVATLTAQASAGNTANTNTATFQLTTNPNGSFSLGAISSALNTDGSMDVTATWRYTESTVVSDFILLVLNKAATAPTALVGYQSVYLAKGTDATTYSYVFRGLPAGTYSCGIVAGRYSAAGEKYTAIYSTSMINTTRTASITAAIGGTALINSVAASTVTGGAANGATSYTWLNAGAANGTTAGHNTVALVQNADGSVNLDLSWAFTQGSIVADRLLVAIKKGTTNPGAVALSDITSGLVDVYEYPVGATAAKIAGLPIAEMVAGVSTKLIYSVGIACAKPSISGATVISAVNSPAGWQNKTVTAVTMGANASNYWDLVTGEFLSTIGTDKTFHLDPVSGDAELTNVPIRSYQGSGIQRRATQLDNDSLDFWDTPDTSPASPEQLRARIGRLGVGGAILMDGEFLAEIESTWGTEKIQSADIGHHPAVFTRKNGNTYIAFSDVTTGNLVWALYNAESNTIGALSTIASNGYAPSFYESDDGVLRIIYVRWETDSYACEKIYTDGTNTWGTEVPVISGSVGNPKYIYFDGALRVSYRSGTIIYWRTWDGATLGTLQSIATMGNTYQGNFCFSLNNNNELYCYYDLTTNGNIYRTLFNGTTWDSGTPITTGGNTTNPYSYPEVKKLINDTEIFICRLRNTGMRYTIVTDGVLGTLVTFLSEASPYLHSYPSVAQMNNGTIVLAYQYEDTGGTFSERVYALTLQRYAQIGAGIIESGSNSNGSWIKYGDGTMECHKLLSGSSDINIATGNVIASPSWDMGDWPEEFYEIPDTSISLRVSSTVSSVWLARHTGIGTLSAGTLNLMSSISRTGVSLTVSMIATGRWRA